MLQYWTACQANSKQKAWRKLLQYKHKIFFWELIYSGTVVLSLETCFLPRVSFFSFFHFDGLICVLIMRLETLWCGRERRTTRMWQNVSAISIEAHQINHNASQISCTSVKCYENAACYHCITYYITASYTYTFKGLHSNMNMNNMNMCSNINELCVWN